MKRQYAILTVLTFVLALILLAALCLRSPEEQAMNAVCVNVPADGKTRQISFWIDDRGKGYCFLPSYADLSASKFQTASGKTASLDGEPIADGMPLEKVELNREYRLQIGADTFPVEFRRAGQIPAMHINTRTGTIRNVTENKKTEESASVTLILPDGTVEYENRKYSDKISGRGNSTWDLEKKPFNLKLNKAAALLGMGSSKKWILLANGYDDTNLRNKIVYDVAQLSPNWSVHCEFVDLYLNQEYAGLYLLTEKIEVTDQKLNLDRKTGILFQSNYADRWKNAGFVTEHGRAMEMEYPKNGQNSALETVRVLTNRMEAALYDGREAVLDYIDLDSWCRRYLIDELFLNRDAEKLSALYYYDPGIGNDKLYAGPVWDYDLAIANINCSWLESMNIPARLISNEKRWNDETWSWDARLYQRFWYAHLTELPEFQKAVSELYFGEYRPAVEKLLTAQMDAIQNQIEASAQMNEIRWQGKLPAFYPNRTTALNAMRDFLTQRIAFLDEYWGGKLLTHNVTARVGTKVYSFEVPVGQSALDTLDHYVTEEIDCWISEATGEEFDPAQMVTEDISVFARNAEPEEENTGMPTANWKGKLMLMLTEYGYVAAVALLLLLLIPVIWIERKYNGGKLNG